MVRTLTEQGYVVRGFGYVSRHIEQEDPEAEQDYNSYLDLLSRGAEEDG